MNTQNDMSGRVNVVLSDEVYETIKNLAEIERRSQSQMTALLVEEALIARGILAEKHPSASSSPAKGEGDKGKKDE